MPAQDAERTTTNLATNTRWYQSILDDQLDLVCRFLPDGELTFVNMAYARYFGRSVEELTHFNLYQLIPEEDRAPTRAAVASITPENPIRVHENRVFDAEGNVRWQRWTNRALLDEHGRIIEYQATGQDITEQRLAEEELRRYRDRLQELVVERTQDLERVNAALSRRIEELTTLNIVSETVSSASSLTTILERIAAALTDLFHAFSTGISVFNEERTQRTLMTWYTSDRTYNGPSHVGRVFSLREDRAHARLQHTKRAFAIEDPASHPIVSPFVRELMQSRNIHSVLYAPLLSRAEVIGSITISITARDRRFTEDELRLVETIATQLAGHVETARLLEMEHRQRERAESLQEVAKILNSTLDQEEVLVKILEQLRRVTHYDGAAVCLLERDALVIFDAAGISKRHIGRQIELDERYAVVSVLTHKASLVITDTYASPRWLWWSDELEIRSWMGAPLLVQGQPVGVLTVSSGQGGAYRAEDARMLQAFADQAAVAVSNARLYRQAQSAAAAVERERLARDLHDAVTQTIFSASIIAEALPLQMQHDPAGASKNLGKLSQLTRGALAEMRSLLLELRPSTLTEVSLAQLLRLLQETFTGRHPIPVELTVTDGAQSKLPPDVQVAVYRIAQEAFNNISRHAQATHVDVQLHQDLLTVHLTIADNGCGFDPTIPKPGHMGLFIMQERAQTVGAELRIDSAPGEGARITLRWHSPKEAMDHA